jgi:hypothetical protein
MVLEKLFQRDSRGMLSSSQLPPRVDGPGPGFDVE